MARCGTGCLIGGSLRFFRESRKMKIPIARFTSAVRGTSGLSRLQPAAFVGKCFRTTVTGCFFL
ncbi:hypothetical protein D3Z52_15025 [Clostridiaceae bacterium]|nr:hypothetical protein [Clostridiaceae bacterium]